MLPFFLHFTKCKDGRVLRLVGATKRGVHGLVGVDMKHTQTGALRSKMLKLTLKCWATSLLKWTRTPKKLEYELAKKRRGKKVSLFFFHAGYQRAGQWWGIEEGCSRGSVGSGNTNVHSTTPRPLVTICFARSLPLSSERTELTPGLSAGIFIATAAREAANSDLQVRGRFIGGETVEGTKKKTKREKWVRCFRKMSKAAINLHFGFSTRLPKDF